MRRKLGVERVCGHRTAGCNDLRGRLRGLVYVRAAEIQFNRRDCVAVELLARLGIVAGVESTDRHPDRNVDRANQTRQRLADEKVATGVRETDRIQHPRVRFGDAYRW